ncbi:hypothetical protein LZ198_13235 [Myxococcus sp. K15C18031901]|uniref:hypothetical protein n=1 Tax=Myxococcus dinghuensis TaxID=2906761 RepID=UPI0020A8136C|nr:hypothetical protein [Myxococcus dinghuensis]MCP3099832.1 hypothetical protein [Myxococcus dinghuensis]
MKAVLQHIAVCEERFASHPFFSDLRQDRPLEQVMAFAPRLTFWVMTFQDVLRLNAHFVQDAHLKALATRHHAEEGGHDQWFEEDIAALTGGSLSIGSLYGKAHARTRDAAYAIISEVHRPLDDRLRIVLLWALESTSHVFFSRTAIISAAKGADDRLKYFSDHHMRAEAQHAMFEQQLAEELEAMVLAPELRAEALAMVDRIYAAFDTMFDGLRIHLEHERADEAPPRLALPAHGAEAGASEETTQAEATVVRLTGERAA